MRTREATEVNLRKVLIRWFEMDEKREREALDITATHMHRTFGIQQVTGSLGNMIEIALVETLEKAPDDDGPWYDVLAYAWREEGEAVAWHFIDRAQEEGE